jgi:hypothetical protein
MARSAADLTPENALIWRVVHRDNVPWILDHGVHCASGTTRDPNYVQIGLPDLIDERMERVVPVPPGGQLSDYVPFYFTPFSPMVHRIVTGLGVTRRARSELCFLVTSLKSLAHQGLVFLVADRHASLQRASFQAGPGSVRGLPWSAWQRRAFKRDPEDPEAFERYQAEVLVHRHLPVEGLQGIVCYDVHTQASLSRQTEQRALDLKVVQRPEWYL